MTTPRIRSLVSLAAALNIILTIGGCVSARSRVAWDGPDAAEELPPAVRFDNDGRDYVHVYLVGEQRQWFLGRVDPGAHATLRIPDAALAGNPEPMRLVVLAGGRVTLRAMGEPGAVTAIPQPARAFLSQRWMFAQTSGTGELTALPFGRAREPGRR